MKTDQEMRTAMTLKERLPAKCAMALACMLACGTSAAAPKAARTWTEPVTGMVFVALPKGCFQMGSTEPIAPPWDSNWGRMGYAGNLSEDEVPKHEVCLDAVWMAKTEVSEAHWHKVMGGEAPAGDGRRAKSGVTWYGAREFARKLSELSQGKLRFRLPTEAEWEYGCRAGDHDEKLMEGERLAGKAWQAASPKRSYKTREVGLLEPNAFGLHDMLGNAWEWTQDSYQADGYARHTLYNPKIDIADTPRVIRGGSVMTEVAQTRCRTRGRYAPDDTLHTFGMRLVRE